MHSTDPSEKIYECTEALILVGHVTVPKWQMAEFHSCYSYSRMYFFNTLKVSSNSDVLYLFSMRRTDYFLMTHFRVNYPFKSVNKFRLSISLQ